MTLITTPNLDSPDDFYAAWLPPSSRPSWAAISAA